MHMLAASKISVEGTKPQREEIDSKTEYFDYDMHRRFGEQPGLGMNSLREQCFDLFFLFHIPTVCLKYLLHLCVKQENASNGISWHLKWTDGIRK